MYCKFYISSFPVRADELFEALYISNALDRELEFVAAPSVTADETFATPSPFNTGSQTSLSVSPSPPFNFTALAEAARLTPAPTKQRSHFLIGARTQHDYFREQGEEPFSKRRRN